MSIVLTVLCLGTSAAAAQSLSATALQRGVAWLQAQVGTDGSLAGQTASVALVPQVQTEVAMTLGLVAGAVPSSLQTALHAGDGDTVEFLARKALASRLAGVDATSILVLLASWQNPDGGWGVDNGYTSNPLDTAWALQALAADSSTYQPEGAQGLAYLSSAANSAGRFGVNGQDSVYVTAQVVLAGQIWSSVLSSAALTQPATTWLLSLRDGSTQAYGSPFLNAHALLALLNLTADQGITTPLASALVNGQSANGSWNDDPYLTALALRALYLVGQPTSNGTTGAVTATVVDAASGSPLAGATAQLIENTAFTAATDSKGSFTLSGVTPGTYTLNVAKLGYQARTLPVQVAAGQAGQLGTISLSPASLTATVSGVVKSSYGNLLSGALVAVGTASTTTNAQGAYTLSNLQPGSATITVSLGGYQTTSTSVVLEAGNSYLFSPVLVSSGGPASATSLTGKVVDAGTQAPLGSARISLNGAPYTAVAADGSFNLTGLASGNFTLALTAPGHYDGTVTGILVAGVNAIGNVGMKPEPANQTATLSGTVKNTSGQGLANVQVSIAGVTTTTNAQGQYTLNSLPPGTATLSVSAAGYTAVSISVELIAGQQFIFSPTLYPTYTTPPTTASIQGRVINGVSKAVLAGASVSINGGSTVVTGADGSFSISNLTPGAFTLTVSLAGFQGFQGGGKVSAGANTVGDVALTPNPAASTLTGYVTDSVTGQPIPGATVSVQGSNLAVSSDRNGQYNLAGLTSTQVTLVVSASGYFTQTVAAAIPQAGGMATRDIALVKSVGSGIGITSVGASKTTLSPQDSLELSPTLLNSGTNTASVVVRGLVMDSQNFLAAELKANAVGLGRNPPNLPLTLVPGTPFQTTLRWNTTRQPAGDYVVRIQALDADGRVLAETAQPVTVVATPLLVGGIALNPPIAQVGTSLPIALSADVTNTGNLDLPAGDATLTVTMAAPDTNVSLAPQIAGKVLTCGAPLNYPTGLVGDGSGALYTYNRADRKLLRVNSDGSTNVVGQFSACSSLTALAMDTGGNFWAGCYDSHYFEMTPTGQVTPFSSRLLTSITAIEPDGGGGMYLAGQNGSANLLTHVDAGGVETTLWRNGLSGATGIVKDGTGHYVVTNAGDGTLSKVDPVTGNIAPFANGMKTPQGITVDGSGNFYVADAGDNTIVRIAADGTRGVYAMGLNQPYDLKFDGSGTLYVSNQGDNTLVKVTSDGVVHPFVQSIANRPQGMRYDSQGNLWIVNDDGTLRKKDGSGRASVVATGFNSPRGIGIDADGTSILVASYGSGVVQRVSAGGNVSTYLTGLSSPFGVAVGPDGNTYVTETGAGRISWFDTQGTRLGQVESLVSYPTRLRGVGNTVYVQNSSGVSAFAAGAGRVLYRSGLSSMAVDPSSGNLVMIYGSTLTRLDASGNVVSRKTLSISSSVIAADAGGNAYLVSGSTFYKVDAQGNVSTFGAVPQGVYVYDLINDGNGNLYYLDYYSSRVYRLQGDGTSQAITVAGLSIFGAYLGMNDSGQIIVPAALTQNGNAIYGTYQIDPAAGTAVRLVADRSTGGGSRVDASGTLWLVASNQVNLYSQGATSPTGQWAGFSAVNDIINVGAALGFVDNSNRYFEMVPGAYPQPMGTTNGSYLATDGVARYSVSGSYVYQLVPGPNKSASLYTIIANASSPSGIAVRADGAITVGDNNYSRVITLSATTPHPIIEDYAGVVSPRGLMFDGQGLLWVASYNGHGVARIDPATGIAQTVSNQVLRPDSLAQGSDGSVWVTADRSLIKITPQLSTLSVPSPFNNLSPTLRGLIVENDGIVVADSADSALLKEQSGSWQLQGLGLGAVSALKKASDGGVFLASNANHGVLKYQNGVLNVVASGLGAMNALALVSDGSLLIAQNSGVISSLRPGGDWSNLPVSNLMGSNNVSGIWSDQPGQFTAVSQGGNCLNRFAVTQASSPPPAGTVVHQTQVPVAALAHTGGYQNLNLGTWLPAYGGDYQITLSRPGYDNALTNFIHVGPAASSTLQAMKSELPPGDQSLPMCMNVSGADFTSISRVEVSQVKPVITIARPMGITSDRAGNIYTTDPTNLYKTTPAGVTTTLLTGKSFVFGLAIDNKEQMYTPGRNAQGTYDLLRIDTQGNTQVVAALGVTQTNGVQVDSAGNILVGSPGRLLKVTPSGTVSTLSTLGISNPRNIAIDGKDNIYVQNENNVISMIKPDGSSVELYSGGDGVANPNFEGDGYPNIAADCADNLYLATYQWSKVSQSGEEHTIAQVIPHTGQVALLLDTLRVDSNLGDIDYLAYDRLNSRLFMWNEYGTAMWQVPVTCGAISVDVHLLANAGQNLSAATQPPSAVVPLSDGRSEYVWSMRDVSVKGAQICFNASESSLQLGELRKTIDSGFISFQNSFANNDVRVPINIPNIQTGNLVDLGVQTNKPAYGPTETATITVSLANHNARVVAGVLTVDVLDAQGVTVNRVTSQAQNLGAGQALQVTPSFAINNLLPASYSIRASLTDGNVDVAAATTQFDVLATAGIGATLALDKAEYRPTDVVRISSAAINASPNTVYTQLTLAITVQDAAQRTLYSTRLPVGELAPGVTRRYTTPAALSNAAAGPYLVVQDLVDAQNQVLDHRTANFQVSATAATGYGLRGTISAEPKQVQLGGTVNLSSLLANSGNSDLVDLPVTLYIVDPEQGEITAQRSETVANLTEGAQHTLTPTTWHGYGPNGPRSAVVTRQGNGGIDLSSQGRVGATYVAILAAEINGNSLTLAQDNFQLIAQIAVGLTATGGTPQSAPAGASYPVMLEATVRDSNTNPIAGVTVTFVAPGSGASVSFPGGNSAVTDAQGRARMAVKANGITGSFTVTATAPGVAAGASFNLRNTAPVAASIQSSGGTPQQGGLEQTFAQSLQATVLDTTGQPVPGVVVTFAAPAVEPTVSFPGGASGVTDANGRASVRVRGGKSQGSLVVTASAPNIQGTASFALTLKKMCGSAEGVIFTPLVNQPLDVPVRSNSVTLSGIGSGCTVNLSISNGQYKLERGGQVMSRTTAMARDATSPLFSGFTAQTMPVQDGDILTLAQRTSAQPGVTTTMQVSLGGTMASWSASTVGQFDAVPTLNDLVKGLLMLLLAALGVWALRPVSALRRGTQ